MDFGGLYSSIMSTQRGGILMSLGDFPESLSQAMLLGIMLVGRLGVPPSQTLRGRLLASSIQRACRDVGEASPPPAGAFPLRETKGVPRKAI